VAGEAGIGKTRLVRALLEDGPEDRLVLRAQCVDLGEPGLPYLAVTDLLSALGSDDAGAPVGAADESARWQLFQRAAALLAEAGDARGPVVVVVEDLQWVDSSSADFLRFLLSRMATERVAVVATVRTDGLANRRRLGRLVGELGRLPAVQRLDLQPFGREEVAQFLGRAGGEPGAADVDDVLRRTGGNPYFVRALAASGADATSGALADLLAHRLDALSDDARAVVQCAAIVSDLVPDRLLRHVSGLPDEAFDSAVRDAVADGVLRPDGAGYRFAHDLVRTAVSADLLPGERARLHGRVADALEHGAAGQVRAAEVAHHAAEAQDARRVLAWSVRAGDEAMRVWAPDEALHHFDRALLAWPEVDTAAEVAESSEGQVALRAARAAGLAGEPTRAAELARRAIRLCDEEGDGPGSVQARAALVRLQIAAGAAGQAIGTAEEAVRLAESPDVDAVSSALAHVVLARALLGARRVDDAREQGDRAVHAAHETGVAGLQVEALTTSALLDEIGGDLDGAAARLADAVRVAQAEGEPAAELRARYALASLRYYNGDVAGSLPVLRAALARVDETGLRWSDSGVELRVLQATALFVTGDLDGSLAVAQAPETRPPDVAAARLAAVGCYAAVARGVPDADRRFTALEDSWDADPQVGLVAGGCEADLLTWQGDPARAVAVAERAQVHLDAVAGEGMYGGLWLSALGLAALADHAVSCRQRRDDPGVAAALAQGEVLRERVERIVTGGHGRPGDLGPEGRAWHARALAEHARLLGEPAVEAWSEALAAFGYGHVYEQGRCHWRLAEALVAAGDRATAATHAQSASAAAERMGAVPLKEAVAATVSRSRLAGTGREADAVLTRRERDVLALVAEGMTNREIGKRLFISDKTASVHLSNVMTKLNVTSRTEAVTVAHRRGLLDIV
jgi:ATP/maltotriose-dependent transcriptional regulator MalT